MPAGRVAQRISEQGLGEYLSLAPPAPEVQVGGRSVLLLLAGRHSVAGH